MPAYFPINCRQQGRLTQFCVSQVLKFFGSILQRKKCSHGRKAKPNAWGRLGGLPLARCKGSSTTQFSAQGWILTISCSQAPVHTSEGSRTEARMDSKPVWRLKHSPWEAQPASSRQNQHPLNNEGGKFSQVRVSLASCRAHIAWRSSCHVTPHWQSLQKTHTWNAHSFLTGKKWCSGDRERGLSTLTSGSAC